MADNFYKQHWAGHKRALVSARVNRQVTVTVNHTRLLVSVPYSDTFRVGATALSARYRPKTCRWSFKVSQSAQVAALVRRVYGAESLTGSGWPKGLEG